MSSGLLQNGSKSGKLWAKTESVTRVSRPKRPSQENTIAQDAGEPGRGDRESATESPSPSEAGRRIKEPGG